MRLRHLAIVATACAAPLAAHADNIDSLQLLNQHEFRLLSEDLGAALSYKGLVPAEPLGITGFDLGFGVTGTSLKHQELLSKAGSGADVSGTLPVPTVRFYKGLPLDIDVGLMYSAVPSSNIKLYGGELRWAVMPGSTLLPAVAVRASTTRLSGVDQLDLSTTSLDVSVSKGFAMLTPYGGVGQVWTRSTPKGVPTLAGESFTQTKVFAGVNINLGVNLAVEVDNTGGINTYGVKLGARF